MKFIRNTEYIIQEDGTVINSKTSRVMSQCSNTNGYTQTTLRIDNKQVALRIHRLVAEAYLENPFKDATVNHIDGDKGNNHVSNLEWISLKDNILHAYGLGLSPRGQDRSYAVLTDKDVEDIKVAFTKNVSNIDLAKKYSVNKATISKIKNGLTWKHIRPDLTWSLAPAKKLEAVDIPCIREAIAIGMPDAEIGKIYGVSKSTITQIRLGNNWKNY